MVIQSSSVGMQATYSYSQRKANSVTYTSWGNVMNSTNNNSATTLPSATDSVQVESDETKNGQNQLLQLEDWSPTLHNVIVGARNEATYEGMDQLEHESLKKLMDLISMKTETKKVSALTLFQQLLSKYRVQMERMISNMRSYHNQVLGEPIGSWQEGNLAKVQPTMSWGEEITLIDFYQESERSTFTSCGLVSTQDGRNINFNISVTMSRSFLSYTAASIDYVAASFVDPLIINLKEDAVTVSDQKFLFDIDTDGELDNISLLSQYCGFLALDRNEDGTINDGSELFGVKSQDGFAELAVFDMDHNHWIDEKDEIFNRLRIWHKDDTGRDELVALGVAGIGAIYLGTKETQFSLNHMVTNAANAKIQKTGIYLKEDGIVGTIQHVDFAK